MIDEKYIDLVTAYLQNDLNTDQQKKLDELIESGKIDLLDLKEMEIMIGKMDSLDTPKPSSAMRDRFYTMLDEEKEAQTVSWSHKLNGWMVEQKQRFQLSYLVYIAAVFLTGLMIGDLYAPISNQDEQIEQLMSEVSQMREVMMISLLDNSSPTERLKAVNISNEIRSVDERVVNALLKTLNNDSNVNVRLAAVDALTSHANNPAARSGLINSIAQQESPIVQAALADAMLALQERQSVDEFKKLLSRDELDSNVRNKLENTIAELI
ncbi:HEAT repeat domain-containing protein [Rhodohalobacter sulfatireducens]|uniref:HEAT repeat domain-containing protein n=1 Tax=Rhodohalobacter sulfatireducens TaxID=2911366 RepID=A0ABS9K8T1_9BACT|nr:HEAT repeat domain-containing protein [Rhodohalobacter sulfatireducens]MCG2587264.1 HEAT repeat domain-containing protein [Rhodohalobacter sulfatireducens]